MNGMNVSLYGCLGSIVNQLWIHVRQNSYMQASVVANRYFVVINTVWIVVEIAWYLFLYCWYRVLLYVITTLFFFIGLRCSERRRHFFKFQFIKDHNLVAASGMDFILQQSKDAQVLYCIVFFSEEWSRFLKIVLLRIYHEAFTVYLRYIFFCLQRICMLKG